MTPRDALLAAAPLDGDEQDVAGSWLDAARVWTDRVRDGVMGPFRQARTVPDAGMVLAVNGVWVEQLNQKVRPTVLGVLRRAYTRARGQQPPDGFDQQAYVTQYLDASVNRMSGIPDEVYRQIARVIADGVAANQPIDEIARSVDQVLTVTGSDRWTNRSVVVARTEVGGAVNAGTLAAAGQRQFETRQQMVKTWVATTHGPSAERTRPAHLLADGQTVALTEPFIVGGEPLQFPGDPSGSAGNVIQCRCTISTRAAERG